MRCRWLAIAGLLLVGTLRVQPACSDERDDAVAAIRQAIVSYVAAYNRGDAEAVANHWSADAEYVLPDGERVQGRDAIRRVFEQALADDERAQIAGVIRSRLFDSDGGFGEGVWTREGDRWVVAFRQTLPDGREAKATNIYTLVDENTFKWHSIGRTVDGEPLPNVDDVTIVRKAAADSHAPGGE